MRNDRREDYLGRMGGRREEKRRDGRRGGEEGGIMEERIKGRWEKAR